MTDKDALPDDPEQLEQKVDEIQQEAEKQDGGLTTEEQRRLERIREKRERIKEMSDRMDEIHDDLLG